MSSTKAKRLAGSRWISALVLAGVLVLGFGLTAMARAQGSESNKGLEGGWRLQVTVRDCITGKPLRPTFPAVFTFAKGGARNRHDRGPTSLSIHCRQLGIWRHEYDHTYSAVSDAFVFSSAGALIATHTFMRVIVVSKDGDSFTDQIALQLLGIDGSVVTGCGTTVASRME